VRGASGDRSVTDEPARAPEPAAPVVSSGRSPARGDRAVGQRCAGPEGGNVSAAPLRRPSFVTRVLCHQNADSCSPVPR